MKILVVDDDKRLLAEVGRILTDNGHSADCFDNADEAVAMAKFNRYDFVLVDYRMPKHDGLWFLKNAALPRSTKVLLVTSFIDRDVIQQMCNAGLSGYVAKPFGERELLRHLEMHSGKNKNRKEVAKAEVSQ